MVFVRTHIDAKVIVNFEFSHARRQNFLIAIVHKLHIWERGLVHSYVSKFLTALEGLLG